MKRRGFVFIETIIVITILSVSLLVVYRAFNTSLNHEETRLNYDAPTYIYRTFYIKDSLNTELVAYEDLLLDENKIITPVTCNNITDANTKNFCKELIQNEKFGVANVYLAKGEISKLFTEHKGEQSILSSGMINYIKTLPDEDGYIFLIEFIENCEKIEGTSADSCEYNYASIKISEQERGPYCDFADLSLLKNNILCQYDGPKTIESKGSPNMAIVPTAETSGLYATQDEYGTSYYYRGEKDSLRNNVIFGRHQWKVVRINGDGSIRLIYNGVCPNNSCTINSTGMETATNPGASYQWSENDNDVKYVGYMYGGLDGEASTSKEQAQKNETDSKAKTILDTWYKNNIYNTKYESYVVDNIFCNDRSIESGTGFGTGLTYFKTYTRLETNRLNPMPSLKCEQKNDRFTVSDTTRGNGALTYPIGLITADEVQYGGIGLDIYNTKQYLYTGQNYWTFSPYYFSETLSNMWTVSMWGYLFNYRVTNPRGYRGVVNLSSKVVIASGDGSVSNPYIIFTE